MDCIPEDISYKRCDCRFHLKNEKSNKRGKCEKYNYDKDIESRFIKGYLNNLFISISLLDEPEKF